MRCVQRVITARDVLIGPAGQHVRGGAVLIEDDTIRAVGPRAEVERAAEPGAVRSDHPRHTLLPGLINCHVHLAFNAGPQVVADVQQAADEELLLGMAGRAQRLLAAGVTTVRDLGDRGGLLFRLREAVECGDPAGPRILASGPPLTPPRGHCWFLGGEVDGPAAIRERVRRNAELGADVIKVMASGGEITPESVSMRARQFTAEDLALVVQEARAAGLPVAAHAHGTDSIADAVAAGVDTVEHCTWMSADGNGYDIREDVARSMVERGIRACFGWPVRWREFLAALGPLAGDAQGRFRWMRDAGLPLLIGTDAGVSPRSGFDEFAGALELYAEFGFPPEEVLEMVTTGNATGIGLGDRTGRLAAGYAADLLVVEGDPRTDLTALRTPSLVLARGRPVA